VSPLCCVHASGRVFPVSTFSATISAALPTTEAATDSAREYTISFPPTFQAALDRRPGIPGTGNSRDFPVATSTIMKDFREPPTACSASAIRRPSGDHLGWKKNLPGKAATGRRFPPSGSMVASELAGGRAPKLMIAMRFPSGDQSASSTSSRTLWTSPPTMAER
jgi:hypothetical protein